MPELEIPDLHLPEACTYLMGIMLSPRDHEKALSFMNAVEIAAYRNVAADLDPKQLSRDELERHFATTLSKTLDDWVRDNHKLVFKGRINKPELSARLFVYVLSCAAHNPVNATLQHAYKIIQKGFYNSRMTGASRASLIKIWSEYSPVAHLWAANAVGPHLSTLSGSRLAEFLSRAERFRAMGEAHKPARSKEPLLDPRETWTVPSRFILPEVPIDLPSPDMLREAMSAWPRHV
jgi:hypothetical protein